jgi:hypothetical protein
MSALSQQLLRGRQTLRVHLGADVTWNGVSFRVLTKGTQGAGENSVHEGFFSAFTSDAAPRLFDFNPLDFLPNTAIVPPIEGAILVRNGLNYLVTAVEYINVDGDTLAYRCSCIKYVNQTVR